MRLPLEFNEGVRGSPTDVVVGSAPHVTLLSDRWPGLAALRRVELADLPTRVAPLSAASETAQRAIWVKRDDLTSVTYGGNKVRKLEWLIGDALAKGCDTIITTGAAGSHHVLATTLFARKHALAVHAVTCAVISPRARWCIR
jgi:1-aminocyclopropane-1-carboxylate deaminase/D-cysteine desulfhydrase-like pyridoxal-dependent ACC family enzyme